MPSAVRLEDSHREKFRSLLEKREHTNIIQWAMADKGRMESDEVAVDYFLSCVNSIERRYGKIQILYAPIFLSLVKYPFIACAFIGKLCSMLEKSEFFMISFELVRFVSPETIAVIRCILKSYRVSEKERKFMFVPLSGTQKANFQANFPSDLIDCMYVRELKNKQRPEFRMTVADSSSYQSRDRIPKFIYKTIDRIETMMFSGIRFSEEELHYLNTAFIESALNVDQHAYSQKRNNNIPVRSGVRYWVSLSNYEKKGAKYIDFRSQLCVFDFGATISGTLLSKQSKGGKVKEECLFDKLIKNRNSRTGLQNRGFGFEDFKAVANDLSNFRFNCLSGRNYMRYYSEKKNETKYLPYAFPGTLLAWEKI